MICLNALANKRASQGFLYAKGQKHNDSIDLVSQRFSIVLCDFVTFKIILEFIVFCDCAMFTVSNHIKIILKF